MSGQPQDEWIVEFNALKDDFDSLKHESMNSFKARLFHKNIKELYELHPNNLVIAELYVISFTLINKKEISLKLFEELILPNINPDLAMSYVKLNANYASLLYSNQKYKEALEIILDLDKMLEKVQTRTFYNIAIPIYFENHLYHKLIETYIEKDRANPDSISLRDLIYLIFSYYYFGKRNELDKCLNLILKTFNRDKLDLENFFEFIKGNLLDKNVKTQLTDLEKEFLENIKSIAKLYETYPIEEIYFDEKIYFHGKEFTLKVSRAEEGGFYGEIDSIDGCYTEGETVEELKANILEVLEMSSEEELTLA